MPFFDRRKFMTSLTGVAGATLAGSIGASGEPSSGDSHSYPKLRITDIKTTMLKVDWGWRRNWMLIRIDTDQGISGYGDTWASDQARAHVLSYRKLLLGKDPTNVEKLFRQMMSRAYINFGQASWRKISG